MFLVGGGCYLNYNKFVVCNLDPVLIRGGHVIVSFGATVIFCVDGTSLEYFHTPPLTFQVVCEWNPLAQSDARGAQTLSFHLPPWDRLQSTWKARGEDSEHLFILSTFEWFALRHVVPSQFPLHSCGHTAVAYSFNFIWAMPSGLWMHLASQKRVTITMSPSENFTSEVGLNCVSFVKYDCCCFRAAFIVWLARSTMPELCGSIRYVKPLFDVQHLAYLFHHLTCEVCALVRFQFWIGAPQNGRIWFATTRATVSALLLRVGIASTHLENLSIITRQ